MNRLRTLLRRVAKPGHAAAGKLEAISPGAELIVDFPAARRLDHAAEYIYGWWSFPQAVKTVRFELNGRPIQHYPVARPDLNPGLQWGFCLYLDLSSYVDLVDENSLILTLTIEDGQSASVALAVDDRAIELARQTPGDKAKKREWLLDIVCCPSCRSNSLQFEHEIVRCEACGSEISQSGFNSLNLLAGPLAETATLTAKIDEVCGHGYDSEMSEIVARAAADGGMVLDAGAGLRRDPHPNVVALDIFDYPSTDVRADALNMPFMDNVFHAVISSATIEHVPDPFRYCQEIVRVLRPGGTLYCAAPFLVPEHAYPDHFFNMARSGMKELFREGVTIERHYICPPNEPIYFLQWFLHLYEHYLPENLKETFLNKTLRDISRRDLKDLLEDEITLQLADEGRWRLCAAHAVIARKN